MLDFEEEITYLNQKLSLNINFDLVSRRIQIGNRKAVFYFLDGFAKSDLMHNILKELMAKKEENLPDTAVAFTELIPHVEVKTVSEEKEILLQILSGLFILGIEGYDEWFMMDVRSYPARSVSEPEKDKVLRGSKDGFVETVVNNTALIRRRIRSTDLKMELMQAGKSSSTDIVLCYMDSRVDHKFLEKIKNRISNIKVDALVLNQESLAECLYTSKWIDPFPKFKYTERPDTAAAQILEGSIIILVDNSPQAMILPVSVLDMIQESDDFSFPPITGTYLRLARFLIMLMTYLIPPTFLLVMNNPSWIPEAFAFIEVKDDINIPLIWQFLMLELAIDGLRLAAVSPPSMLSTPLSVTAGIVLGEFSVKSGWFNSETMLYMAFVAIATYTHPSYELGYAIKFFRIIHLILVSVLQIWGYLIGFVLVIFAIVSNKMISGQSYLYPILPFKIGKISKQLIRKRLPHSKE